MEYFGYGVVLVEAKRYTMKTRCGLYYLDCSVLLVEAENRVVDERYN